MIGFEAGAATKLGFVLGAAGGGVNTFGTAATVACFATFAAAFAAGFAAGLTTGFGADLIAFAGALDLATFCTSFGEAFFADAFEGVGFLAAVFMIFLPVFAAAGAGFASFDFFTILVAAAKYLARPFFFAFGANFFVITSFSERRLYE